MRLKEIDLVQDIMKESEDKGREMVAKKVLFPKNENTIQKISNQRRFSSIPNRHLQRILKEQDIKSWMIILTVSLDCKRIEDIFD